MFKIPSNISDGQPRLANAIGVATVALGALVLIGWVLDIPVLKSVGPGLSTMKVNTALLLAVSGATLWLQSDTRSHHLPLALASIVIAVASVTLVEYVTGRSLGIDELFFVDTSPVPASAPPGRMGTNTAICFLLGGIAQVLAKGQHRVRLVSQVFALSSASIAAVAVVGYAYSARSLLGFGSYTQMAAHTAVAFVFLGIGTTTAQADVGISEIINSSGPGGMLVRKVLPAVLTGPFVIGWFRLQGQRAGLYGTEVGVAMFVVVSSLVLAGILLVYADRIDRIDALRRAAEEEVRQHDERTRFALLAAKTGVWDLDLATGRLQWSDTMASIFGVSVNHAPRTEDEFFRLVHSDDRDAVKTSLRRTLAGSGDYAVEFRTTWPDGSMHWIYGRAQASLDTSRRPLRLTGVGLDVTERKLLEEQLRQSQKLEAIGHLAGGVAHDFNNVLTAIIGYSDLLLSELDPDSPSRADIEEVRKAGDRAQAITQQLLAFSRRQILQPRVLDINGLVEDIQKMLRRLVPEHIQITSHLSSEVGSIKADPTQIEQVLLNLAVNAKDAMPQGGVLTIETANMALDASYQQQHTPVVPGDYVMLSVADTGLGMDAETQRRIFEPFFTTKGLGKGTGLGLATVYGIVKQSGGYIWMYSELGHGTTFKVYLPRVYEAVAPDAARVTHAAKPQQGSETVLVVEDELGVRSLTRRILEQRGYRVLVASAPAEALEVVRSYAHQVDLLLSDVIMPGSGNISLFEQLARERRGIRVLYMSGYADETIVRQGLLVEGVPFLQKPFTAKGLLEKVREVLDSPGR